MIKIVLASIKRLLKKAKVAYFPQNSYAASSRNSGIASAKYNGYYGKTP